jgi:hypothetical protein
MLPLSLCHFPLEQDRPILRVFVKVADFPSVVALSIQSVDGLRQRFVHYSHTAHPADIMGIGVFTKPLAPSPV